MNRTVANFSSIAPSKTDSSGVLGIPTRRTHGFTILQVVAAAAIIAVLGAIILPAIGSAVETARRARCTNSLRQIGAALAS